jgi:hypothetical protein
MIFSRCTKYNQLIPEKVLQNITGIENRIQPKIKGYSRDNLFEVVSLVAFQTRKHNQSAQLRIAYIKQLVPQGDRYMHELMIVGIINRTGNAVKGKTSYQYSFAPEYFSKLMSLPLDNQKLINRITKMQECRNKINMSSIRGHSEQVKFLNRLTIDPGYEDVVKMGIYFEKNLCFIDNEHYNRLIASAVRLENRDIFYSVDTTAGRFHSNITTMPKLLRSFLRIDGEQLVNIDIKNSQPFLSIILLSNPAKVAPFTKNSAFALLLRTLKVPQKQDVSKYISLVVSGQLYEYLMSEFSNEGINLTRSDTKVEVLRILFARNRLPKNDKARKARRVFIRCFPTVHRTFSKIRGREKGDSFSNFKRFAILLQRIESHLILRVILKRINQEMPGTIALTIHDSIMTKNDPICVEAVSKILLDEISKFIGYQPKIEIEGLW